MTQLSNQNRIGLLLSTHRAILGIITPTVRAIYIQGFETEQQLTGFTLRVYFESEPTEEEKERFRVVTTEVMSDFSEEIISDEEFLILPHPQRWVIRENEIPIYIRYESLQ